MLAKILIGSGTLIMILSIIGIFAGIIGSFQALKTNENVGIGAVGRGLDVAVSSNILFFVGLFILMVGLIKFFRDKKARM